MSHLTIVLTALQCFSLIHGMVQPQQQSSVFQSISSSVHLLEAHISEMQMEGDQALAAHKAEYEQRLLQERDANTATAASNAKLQAEITEQAKKNQKLRTQAKLLQADIKVADEDLQALQQNFTTGIEVIAKDLNQTDDSSLHLEILEELDHADRERAAVAAHQRLLGEVGAAKTLAALQVEAGQNPSGLLQALDADLKDLKSTYKRKEDALHSKFEELWRTEAKRHQSLLQEQAELNDTKVEGVQLGNRLETAVSFLEARRAKVQELSTSIRMYAQRVGIRPTPLMSSSPQERSEEDSKMPASQPHANGPIASGDTVTAVSDVGDAVWPTQSDGKVMTVTTSLEISK